MQAYFKGLPLVVTSLVMVVGHWTHCFPVLEQPTGSDMPKCEPLCSVLQHIGAGRIVTWHGAFDGESPKPLQLRSPQDLSPLRRDRPAATETRTRLCTVEGSSYSGKADCLRVSQTYSYLHQHAPDPMNHNL